MTFWTIVKIAFASWVGWVIAPVVLVVFVLGLLFALALFTAFVIDPLCEWWRARHVR